MAVTLTLFNVAIQLAERLVIRDDVITACNGSKITDGLILNTGINGGVAVLFVNG